MSNLRLEDIVNELGADSAAIMMPDDAQRQLYCYDSFNMPHEWTEIKNSYDEKVSGGNVEVYMSNEPAITNGLKKMHRGFFIESVLIIPILRNRTTIGTLELIMSKTDKIFTVKDKEKAVAFAEELELKRSE